ncbi:unnamed protein product [Toxocara canis]|uniref:DUF4283 domain-containing protein n=1 Tax=Toxocara canis TaxID=6265 RepID=A0A183UFI8_TOXCA|nr:unnamed protein product [Toxocara canis]
MGAVQYCNLPTVPASRLMREKKSDDIRLYSLVSRNRLAHLNMKVTWNRGTNTGRVKCRWSLTWKFGDKVLLSVDGRFVDIGVKICPDLHWNLHRTEIAAKALKVHRAEMAKEIEAMNSKHEMELRKNNSTLSPQNKHVIIKESKCKLYETENIATLDDDIDEPEVIHHIREYYE